MSISRNFSVSRRITVRLYLQMRQFHDEGLSWVQIMYIRTPSTLRGSQQLDIHRWTATDVRRLGGQIRHVYTILCRAYSLNTSSHYVV